MVLLASGGMMDTVRLTVQVVRSRWFMVFASFLIMSAAGATYIFGIYSKDIKSSLGYDQQTLNTLSFFKDLGANVGILSGLINEVTPPWVVLLIGAAMNFAGYFTIYLAITGRLARRPPSVWQMCVCICVGANSQSFANTGALVTCVKNFPRSRGVVLGLLKGFVGLSGAIITQLYLALYGDDSKSLVLLIAWLPAAISVVFLHTVRIIMPAAGSNSTCRSELKVFYAFLYISLLLAAYLMVAIIMEKKFTFSHPEYSASAAVVLFLLFLPLAVVIREEIRSSTSSSFCGKKSNNHRPLSVKNDIPEPESIAVVCSTVIVDDDGTGDNYKQHQQQQSLPTTTTTPSSQQQQQSIPAVLATTTTEEEAASAVLSSKKKSWKLMIINLLRSPERGEDYSILQALVSVDMLVLFVATICGVGGTLTAIDNMGQIGESLGYPPRSISTFVSLISIWNYCGRVTAGFASEIFLAKYKLPRPAVLTLVLLVSCVGHLLIAFGPEGSLYAASVVIGFCFGAQWPLLFAIISEIFGLKHYSTLYNMGGVASPIGSYILNVRVAGHLYDVEAEKMMKNNKAAADAKGIIFLLSNANTSSTMSNRGDQFTLTCLGVQCFKASFLIITAATFFGALVSMILVWRTKKFYRSDIYARFRSGGSVGGGGRG